MKLSNGKMIAAIGLLTAVFVVGACGKKKPVPGANEGKAKVEAKATHYKSILRVTSDANFTEQVQHFADSSCGGQALSDRTDYYTYAFGETWLNPYRWQIDYQDDEFSYPDTITMSSNFEAVALASDTLNFAYSVSAPVSPENGRYNTANTAATYRRSGPPEPNATMQAKFLGTWTTDCLPLSAR